MTLHVTHPIVPPTQEMARIAEARATRNLLVMFADIASAGDLYELLGEARARRLIAAAAQLMTDAAQACGGRIVKPVGDTLLSTFSAVDDGARGAIAIQQALLGLQVPDAERVALRIGFNYGPVVEVGGDVYGDSVNVVARLVQIAQPRQILTTTTCIEQLSPAHRAKARELQLIYVRAREHYLPVWELQWRPAEQAARDAHSAARQAGPASPLRIEFRGRSWELWRDGDALTIGRDDTNDLRLDGGRASRNHARILVRDGKFVLIDHSTNGTYVLPEGGESVGIIHEERMLSGSGQISFGSIAANTGTELVRYASGERTLSRAAGSDGESPA